MTDFYKNLSAGEAVALNRLSRLLVELRESRRRLLARHGVEDERTLLAHIRSGVAREHPAYEDYLGVRTIDATCAQIRADLRQYMLDLQ